MMDALTEAARAAVQSARSAVEIRRVGDALISVGIGVWIAVLDGQGVPRAEALARIVAKVRAMAEEVSEHQPKELDS